MKTIFALGSLFLAVSGLTVSDNTEKKIVNLGRDKDSQVLMGS